MSKKQLTIAKRVDILLKEGVDNPKKWVAVHGYTEPSYYCDDCPTEWREEWQRLRDHHIKETNFLFEVIGELVKRQNKCPECKNDTLVPREGCLVCPTCMYARG